MEIKKPTYEELEYEVVRLRKLQKSNQHSNDAISFHHSSMNTINNAIHTAVDIDEMMENVLQAVLELFDTERAWLLIPCDPKAKTWTVPMERTKVGYEGAHALGKEIPMLPQDAEFFKRMQNCHDVVCYDYIQNPDKIANRFSVLSEMLMSLYPKTGKYWIFGVHQCTYARVWTNDEKALFKEIGNRLSDALNSFLYLKELKESKEKFKVISEISPLAIYMTSGINQEAEYINPIFYKLFGYTLEEVPSIDVWWSLAYPDTAYRNTKINEWRRKVEKAISTKSAIEPMETVVTCKDGSTKNIIWGFVSTDIQNWAYGLDVTKQKQAEESLRISKVAVENLTNSLADIVISVKMPERVIEWCNNSIRAIEYEPLETIGKTTAFLFINEESYLDFAKRLEKSFAEGNDFFITEQVFKKKNGDTFLAEVRVTFEIENGVIVHATIIIRDITEQKQIEDALQESEERYRLVLENSMDAILLTAPDGRVLSANAAATKMLQRSEEEICKLERNGLVDMDDPRLPLLLHEREATGKVKGELNMLRKDGIKLPVELSTSVFKNKNGEILTSMIIRDITERKQIESELYESEIKYRALFDNAPLSYQSLDGDGCFIDINPSWLRTLGYERHEVIGKLYADFLHPDWKENFEKNFTIFKKRGYINDVEFKIKHKKGHFIDIAFEGCIGYLPDGSFKQTYCVFQDITERKQAEDVILQNQKRLFEAERIGEFGNWSLEPSTRTIEWSEGVYRIFGLDSKQEPITYERLLSCIHEEDREKQHNYFERMQKLLPGQVLASHEYRIVLPSGEIRWLEVDVETQFDKENKPSYFFGTTKDITERKELLKTLQQRNAYIESILENMPIGFALNTINDGEVKYMNDKFESIYGWSKDILTNTSVFYEKVFPDPKHRAKMLAEIIPDIESCDPDRMNWDNLKIVTSSGEERYIHGVNIPLPDQNLMISTVQNVTERKQAEGELEKSQNSLLLAQKAGGVGTWEVDLKANTMKGSEQFAEIHGFSKQLFSMDEMFSFVPPEEQEKLDLAFKEVLKPGGIYNIEHPIIHQKSGDIKWVHAKGMAIRDENDELIGVLGTTLDITERKQAELLLQKKSAEIELKNINYQKVNEQFRRSNQLLEESQSIAKLGGWELDLLTGKLYWTAETYRIHDTSPEEFNPTVDAGVGYFLPESKQAIIEALENATKNGIGYDLELETYTTKGRKIDVRTTGVVTIINGKAIKISGIFQDISDQKKAQKALIESEQRLNEAQRMAAIGHWIQDVPLNKLTWSDETYRIFEVAKDFSGELLDKFFESIYPEDRETVANAYQNSLITKEPYEISHRIQLQDGRIKYIHERCETEYDKNGNPVRSIGTVQDVSKLRKIEKDLIHSQEKLDFALQGGEIGIWEWDLASNLTIWDAKMEHMFGLNTGEFNQTYDAFKKCLHPDDIASAEYAIKNAIEGVSPYNIVYRVVWKNKEVKYIQAKAIVLKDANGEPITMIGICIDVSSIKKAEDELIKAKEKAEESDRLKSAFLANMSHEIRTPMNGILGFSELLKSPKLSGEKQQKYIGIIEKSGNRMLNIINDIIDVSKIEAGLMKLDITESDINEQLEYIYTFFKPEVEAKGMTLSLKNTLPSKEAIIKTDREKVFAVLTNLVKNAIKYSNKGHIEIGYSKKGETLNFFVKDTGIGIPKDRQESIFERFIQADIEDKMARQGAGLGLAITKAYIEMLGGKLWVESEEGIGSIFYFTLPYNVKLREKSNANDIEGSDNSKNQIKNLKVLIAEDDETSEMLLSIYVKEFSDKITIARTGIEAIETCRNNPDIDLIMMDIQLPEISGYEATSQIRKFNKDVVIIAQTAYGLSGDKEKAIKVGCNDYISKPIKQDELLVLIQKHFKK